MYYILSLLCLVMAFTSCEKYEPELFDEGANGAYFDYGYAVDFDKMVNFGEYIVGHPDTVDLELKIKLLGYLHDEARTLAVKTKEIEGYQLAKVSIDEVVFADSAYEKNIVVRVERPEMEDSIYAVCIYLDGSGDIGTAINGKDSINLYVTETYDMPTVWYSHVYTLLGNWNKEKHIFLAEHTGDNHFYEALYDNELGQHIYNSIFDLNVSAVNALLASEPTSPVVVDIPILKEFDYPEYNVPYFWDNYKEYLGEFRTSKFCRFTTMLGGSNTRDIAALYASEAGQLKMEEEAADFHKDDVYNMLDEYYRFASLGLPISEYKSLCWVEMKSSVVYTMRIPFWWADLQDLGTGDIVKRYFGEYSDEKYQFMLKTMMKKEGTADFVAASILPFVYDVEHNTYTWDRSSLGKNQLAGEERLKECYRIIKAEYDLWAGYVNYEIPTVDLD